MVLSVLRQVGSNAGIVGMTKEHLGLALALNVPVFVVVTKIDMCPANILQGKCERSAARAVAWDLLLPWTVRKPWPETSASSLFGSWSEYSLELPPAHCSFWLQMQDP